MAQSYTKMLRKLQKAINMTFSDYQILINTTQFYSTKKEKPMTCWHIKRATLEENGRTGSIELFSAYNALQCVWFLRDLWYELNGWEIPTDNEYWEELKAKRREKEEGFKYGKNT